MEVASTLTKTTCPSCCWGSVRHVEVNSTETYSWGTCVKGVVESGDLPVTVDRWSACVYAVWRKHRSKMVVLLRQRSSILHRATCILHELWLELHRHGWVEFFHW